MSSPPNVVSGYLRTIRTTTVTALESTFAIVYPEADPQGGTKAVYCSLEYPRDPTAMPSVWSDFETTELRTAGINYTETDPASGAMVTRWVFQGMAVFTVVAMNDNECDEVFDQLISMLAFSSQSNSPGSFRSFIDDGELIASTWSFDKIEMRGQGAAPGTPWNTDDVIYERGLAVSVRGEFYSSPVTLTLVPLREIQVIGTDTTDDAVTQVNIGSQPALSATDQEVDQLLQEPGPFTRLAL